jgi:hypothetical protein
MGVVERVCLRWGALLFLSSADYLAVVERADRLRGEYGGAALKEARRTYGMLSGDDRRIYRFVIAEVAFRPRKAVCG